MSNDNLDRVLGYLYTQLPNPVAKTQILSGALAGDTSIPLDAILVQLINEGHVYKDLHTSTDGSAQEDRYALTWPGIAFFSNAAITGKPYHSKEIGAKTTNQPAAIQATAAPKKEEWAARNWMLVAAIAFLLGIFTYMLGQNINYFMPKAKHHAAQK